MSPAKFCHAIAISVALLCAPGLHAKALRALIVGVSDYPNLSKDFQLEGPRNDAVRMRSVLTRRGFAPQQITVLADGVTGAALPTRGNILAELDRLAKTAVKDDFVLLYFAGHGSQQPVDRNTPAGRAESDGLFEIFLPRDVGKWSGEQSAVENALVKTELRDAVDRILAKGAFVWGVFDSCHSATMVRGANTAVRYRYVDPGVLGVPQTALDAAVRAAPRMRGGPAAPEMPISAAAAREGAGGSVFFYAAQTREATPEMRLPLGRADGKQYGLFGFMVMEALETGAPMSYRQMAQYVLTRYGAMNETRVTPLFSGTDLDQPVLQQEAPPIRQWKIERGRDLVVNGGALARLNEGTIVAVMADPLAGTQAAAGYLKLVQVGLAASTATPVDYRGKPALKPDAIPKGSFARVVQAVPQYALRVSVDAQDCAERCMPQQIVNGLRAAKDGVAGAVITWLDGPAPGDVMLKLLPDRIVLLPASLQGVDCVRSAPACEQGAVLLADPALQGFGGGLREKLAESLHAVARATNLLRIAARLADAGRSNSQLDVGMTFIARNGTALAYTADQVPMLHVGDRIAVSLRNKGLTPIDATMLYVDARYGINVLFPGGAGASNRLEPGAAHDFEVDINDDTVGLERMLTIAVEAQRGQERADFSFLGQSPLAATRGAATRGEDTDVMAFMDAGFSAYRTRAASVAPRAPSARTAMQVFTFNIAR